jgi:hypothetical protein
MAIASGQYAAKFFAFFFLNKPAKPLYFLRFSIGQGGVDAVDCIPSDHIFGYGQGNLGKKIRPGVQGGFGHP